MKKIFLPTLKCLLFTALLLNIFTTSSMLLAQTKYTIPVVVHVISPKSGGALLTDQQVKDGIKNLNLQFQGLYAKTMKDKIISPYQNSITDFSTSQFKLATRDTNNNVTTGIYHLHIKYFLVNRCHCSK
jgi:hypothetical protein